MFDIIYNLLATELTINIFWILMGYGVYRFWGTDISPTKRGGRMGR